MIPKVLPNLVFFSATRNEIERFDDCLRDVMQCTMKEVSKMNDGKK
jgi:hypothetical protein